MCARQRGLTLQRLPRCESLAGLPQPAPPTCRAALCSPLPRAAAAGAPSRTPAEASRLPAAPRQPPPPPVHPGLRRGRAALLRWQAPPLPPAARRRAGRRQRLQRWWTQMLHLLRLQAPRLPCQLSCSRRHQCPPLSLPPHQPAPQPHCCCPPHCCWLRCWCWLRQQLHCRRCRCCCRWHRFLGRRWALALPGAAARQLQPAARQAPARQRWSLPAAAAGAAAQQTG